MFMRLLKLFFSPQSEEKNCLEEMLSRPNQTGRYSGKSVYLTHPKGIIYAAVGMREITEQNVRKKSSRNIVDAESQRNFGKL